MKSLLSKTQRMLKKIANADDIVDGDVETMVQSALAIDADSSVDNSDVATLIQMMQCMLKAMDYASDTGDGQ